MHLSSAIYGEECAQGIYPRVTYFALWYLGKDMRRFRVYIIDTSSTSSVFRVPFECTKYA